MLSEILKPGLTMAQLLPEKELRLFPGVKERGEWDKLPALLKESLIKRGEQYLDYKWPDLTAEMYMEFAKSGNRSIFEEAYFKRRNALSALVLAECAEGLGRFMDDIINGIWCICEESSWTLPAHNYYRNKEYVDSLPDVTSPIIDLFSAQTSADLALVHSLLKEALDEITPMVTGRVEYEIKQRIIEPFLNRYDFWWMGLGDRRRLNNWTPWCTSNCIISLLFMEKDRSRLENGIKKSMEILDRFIDGYPSDGGCDEGPQYWKMAGGSLFDCLELLYAASDGRINVYDRKLIGEIGRYVQRMHISGRYFVNFADGDAIITLPEELLFRYGKRTGDNSLSRFALSLCPDVESKVRGLMKNTLLRQLYAVFDEEWLNSGECPTEYIRDVYLDGIQVMVARERQNCDRGLFVAAKGGNNNESHNHNDVGHFIVYYNGKPMIIDVGVEEYTAKTFSDRRYEIWTMQSAYHNVPMVNGVQQRDGFEYRAEDVRYRAEDGISVMSMDISRAYPSEAGIISWIRSVKLDRAGKAAVEISDDLELERETSDICLTLMTLFRPMVSDGAILVADAEGDGINITYDNNLFDASVEEIVLDDSRLQRNWGNSLHRILLRLRRPVAKATWKLTVTAAENKR